MTHDMYAWLSEIDRGENQNLSPLARQMQLALRVIENGDAAAKQKAMALEIQPLQEFSYHSPGMAQPFLATGLALQLSWTLQTPFFSRSGNKFDAVDNPVSRDYLSNTPVLKASGAKGMLANLLKMQDNSIACELFGEKNATDSDTGKKGNLIIGDVQFSSTGHDIFSPHDRRFGVVDHPVGFEVVPAGSKAEWGIMVPSLTGENWRGTLVFLLRAIQALLWDYGLSAKRSSGYGIGTGEIQVTAKIGEKVKIPSEYQKRGGNEFSEPKPDEPDAPVHMPEGFEVLVREDSNGQQQMACKRENAFQTLWDFKFSTTHKKKLSKKQKKQLGKKKQKFKKKWGNKDVALKRWDRCHEIVKVLAAQSPDNIARQHEALKEWEHRKKYHEKARPVYYQFTLKQAIGIVQNKMEVL